MKMRLVLTAGVLITQSLLGIMLSADTLELVDGTVIKDCYVRDEGIELIV
ncbi:MAG: hypothetical protein ACUVRS_12570 [Armatimonadota bacterium]